MQNSHTRLHCYLQIWMKCICFTPRTLHSYHEIRIWSIFFLCLVYILENPSIDMCEWIEEHIEQCEMYINTIQSTILTDRVYISLWIEKKCLSLTSSVPRMCHTQNNTTLTWHFSHEMSNSMSTELETTSCIISIEPMWLLTSYVFQIGLLDMRYSIWVVHIIDQYSLYNKYKMIFCK